MRKALLVITLIAASFAGGAAVNGPGLQWLKGQISSRLHSGDTIPTLDVDDDAPKVQDEARPETPAPSDVPSAPAPPLGASLTRSPAVLPAEPNPAPKTASSPDPKPAPAETLPPLADPPKEEVKPPIEEARPIEEAAPPPLTAPSDPPVPPPAPVDPPIRPKASGWADAPGPAPSTAVLPRPKTDRSRTNDAAVATATVAPEPPASIPAPAPADWGTLRKRMRTMGVTKYWVEGTPGGTVTFRCLVPSAGDAAVGQQFEAEGDDEIRAAESALRRVAVWQATEKIKE